MKTCLIGYPIRTFQSLLWRICHFDLKNRTYISIYSICFNPCYDGFVILTFFRCYTILIYCLCVSILVMTDLSFWLKPLCSFLVVFFGFNPCYDGFVILTRGFGRIGSSLKSFNPCYDGFVILTSSFWFELVHDRSFNPCYDGFVILTRG